MYLRQIGDTKPVEVQVLVFDLCRTPHDAFISLCFINMKERAATDLNPQKLDISQCKSRKIFLLTEHSACETLTLKKKSDVCLMHITKVQREVIALLFHRRHTY